MQHLTWLLVAMGAFAGSLSAQAPAVASRPKVAQAIRLLEGWLDGQRTFEQVPAVSAAVVFDQEVVWLGGYGLADRERNLPATPQTLYSICSISKLFTSIGVMQLRDAGKLRLDDPVDQHLPWFDLKQTAPEWGPITIQGMLTHSSGLPRESNQPYWTGPDFPFPTAQAIREGLSEQETLYPPDTYLQYSNLGMAMLGEVIAARSGKPYDEYITTNVLAPLGMTSTTPEIPAAEYGRKLAIGYGSLTRDAKRDRVPLFQARGIAPAAGYASNAEDLARFVSWQFRLLRSGSNHEVLKAPTLREMQRVHWTDQDFSETWGLGFIVSRDTRDGGRTFVGHDGSCPGYRTAVLQDMDDRIGVIFLANAMVDTDLYADGMFAIMAPPLRAAAKDTTTTVVTASALERYAGRYTSQPWGSERLVVPWDDGLALIGLPTRNPMSGMTKLKKTGEHTFRRIRSDETLGETWIFSVGSDGRATRFTVHGNHYPRITP